MEAMHGDDAAKAMHGDDAAPVLLPKPFTTVPRWLGNCRMLPQLKLPLVQPPCTSHLLGLGLPAGRAAASQQVTMSC